MVEIKKLELYTPIDRYGGDMEMSEDSHGEYIHVDELASCIGDELFFDDSLSKKDALGNILIALGYETYLKGLVESKETKKEEDKDVVSIN